MLLKKLRNIFSWHKRFYCLYFVTRVHYLLRPDEDEDEDDLDPPPELPELKLLLLEPEYELPLLKLLLLLTGALLR